MSFPIAAWASALFFLFALILIRRFKPQISRVDLTSYGNMSSGLILLAIFSLGKVYFQMGVLAQVPFLSEATFFDIVFAIGMISGTIFLLHGVSSFMPLARLNRQADGTQFRRLEFIRKIEQLTAVENRLDVLLERTLEQMVQAFDFETGIVYKYSAKTDNSRLVSTTGQKLLTAEQFKSVRFNIAAGTQTAVDLMLPKNISQPEIILPVMVDNVPAGFFLLWSNELNLIERDEHQNLKIAAEIISRKIIADRNLLQYDFLARCERLRRQIQAGLKQDQTIGEGLAQLTGYLAGELTFNLATLTIIDSDTGSLRRLSVGPNNALLDEKGLALTERMGITNHVSRTSRPVRVTNYADHSQTLYEDILEHGKMNSALAIPIIDDHRVIAVLMLASERSGTFRQADSTMLTYAASGLAQLVSYEQQRSTVSLREKRLAKITSLMRDGLRLASFEEVAGNAASVIANELPNCQVRISLIEDEASFLKSIALASKSEVSAQVPVDGRMILSLMPCHTEVIENGKSSVVNQNDQDSTNMPESETTQALNSGLGSAMIVPVRIDSQTQGLISVGGMSNQPNSQFEAADVVFIEAVADVLSMTKTAIETKAPATPPQRIDLLQTLVEDQAARGQARSSLTGILGSIEMLRATDKPNPDSLNRYLSIIDSSARKLNECLTDKSGQPEETILG